MIQLSEIPGFIEGVEAVTWVQGLLRLEMKPKNAVFIRVCLMKRQRGLAWQGKQGWGAVCYFPCKFQFVSEKLVGEETHSFPYSSGQQWPLHFSKRETFENMLCIQTTFFCSQHRKHPSSQVSLANEEESFLTTPSVQNSLLVIKSQHIFFSLQIGCILVYFETKICRKTFETNLEVCRTEQSYAQILSLVDGRK